MTVQSAFGQQWPKRDWTPAPALADPMDVDRDQWSSDSRQTAANPYDQAIDSLRTAALRRDAALAAMARTAKPDDTAADEAIAEEAKPETTRAAR